MALALALVLPACHSGPDAAIADGGPLPDTSPRLCATPTACDDTSVHACRDGKLAEVIERCAPELACSRGRCTSAACAAAELDQAGVLGCTFYTLHLENVTSDEMLPSSVIVTNPGQTSANATLQGRSGGQWVEVAKAVVPPMHAARLQMPAAIFETMGTAAQLALRLVSDQPVTAMHVQSDDTGAVTSRSSGATMLLPEHVLGRRYRAIAYPQIATPAVGATDGSRAGAAQLAIVATQDHTTVTLTPPATVTFSGGLPAAGPNGAFKFTLDDGDFEEIYTAMDGDDLTGAEIVADKGIAVFSGNISTTYGQSSLGINSADLAHEQLLPVSAWARTFVAAALPPREGLCDSFYDAGPSSIWRVVADQPGTQVTFTPASGVTGPFSARTLDAGEPLRLFVPANVSFSVSASAPIEMMQGMDCEATLSSAVPTDLLLDDLWFSVLPTYDSALAVVRKTGQPVFLDDARVDDTLFSPAGGGYEVGEVELPPCAPTDVVCAHHLAGQFGVTMRGEDVVTSWATTVPAWNVCTDPDRCGQ
ncbi:MAG TPA: IgGFc-binding protein [Polyangia bacterium]|nr:IgGFc-binding protein [Polyangia bacterium]